MANNLMDNVFALGDGRDLLQEADQLQPTRKALARAHAALRDAMFILDSHERVFEAPNGMRAEHAEALKEAKETT